MWWRPEPSSVSPIYMPGRLRTASSPRRILIDSAPYSSAPARGSRRCGLTSSGWLIECPSSERDPRVADMGEARAPLKRGEQLRVGAGKPGLRAKPGNLVEQGGASVRIEMGDHLVE